VSDALTWVGDRTSPEGAGIMGGRFTFRGMFMQLALILGALLLLLTALADAASARLHLQHAIVLVVLGACLSLIPALGHVSIDADLVLLVFLPPLIYAAGVGMSWRGFRKNLRPILLLAIGCVLFTASAVALAGHFMLGMPWAVAFLLGSVVSPPDPVAPMAVARRLKVPRELLVILEGEGLANDATALILMGLSVAAVLQGGFSLTRATITFMTIVTGELIWGLAVAWASLRLRQRVNNPPIEIILALLTPYLAFWLPHMLGGSGVLAALGAGLYVSWSGPRFISPATRLQGYFVWGLLTQTLEGLLFLLMGLQAHMIAAGLGKGGWHRALFAAAIVSFVVIVVRFIWVFPAVYLPRWLWPSPRKPQAYPPWQQTFFIGFTGIRGVVSLAAALSIPISLQGDPFPERDLILFVTFCVIFVTLIGQGSLLPFLLPSLGLVQSGTTQATLAKAQEVRARIEGVRATLAELDHLQAKGASASAVASLRQRHENRLAEYLGTADESVMVSPVADDATLQAQLIDAERRKVGELYMKGEITDEARRRIERELDLEDARNRHAFESATGENLTEY
jgi:Na+/H+ antiporter